MSQETLLYSKTFSIDILDRAGEGENVIVYCMAAELIYLKVPSNMTVVMIYPYDWSYSMTPWEYTGANLSGPRAKRDTSMEHTGGGQSFGEGFIKNIIEPTEAGLSHHYTKRYIAGYSLGGLMAAYLSTTLNVFDGFASVSGSFWYPGATEYFAEHPHCLRIAKAYYSLGNKEALTSHPERCEVETCTHSLLNSTRLQGIEKTTLEMNEGGHFHNISERIIKALQYLLTD